MFTGRRFWDYRRHRDKTSNTQTKQESTSIVLEVQEEEGE